MATNSARSSTSPSNPERQRVETTVHQPARSSTPPPILGRQSVEEHSDDDIDSVSDSCVTTPSLLDIDISAYKKLTKLLERETEILERESARISVGSLEQGTSISSNPTLPLALALTLALIPQLYHTPTNLPPQHPQLCY